MNTKEYVQMPSEDWTICLCGNEPHIEGFQPCIEDGSETEPDIESEWRGLYICSRCARIIDTNDGSVIGVASETVQNDNAKRWE